MRIRVLDLFCGGGGAAMGYYRAGFEVVGVDIKPQPRFPFEFHIADAMTYPLDGYDIYHASPPCQGYSVTRFQTGKMWPLLIGDVRRKFIATGKPYIIENVYYAKPYMINPLMLCGTMFGLNCLRHRLFETWPPIYFPPSPCAHVKKCCRQGRVATDNQYQTVTGHTPKQKAAEALGIDWMLARELSQAIPPAYTEYIGNKIKEIYETTKSQSE